MNTTTQLMLCTNPDCNTLWTVVHSGKDEWRMTECPEVEYISQTGALTSQDVFEYMLTGEMHRSGVEVERHVPHYKISGIGPCCVWCAGKLENFFGRMH